MQTFIVSTDHNKTARALDSKRLFKQLLEGYQLLRAGIAGPGWVNHPARKMWVGYEFEFMKYLAAIDTECKIRGISSYELYLKILEFWTDHFSDSEDIQPLWLTDPVLADRVITSNRYRLYQKDPTHYAQWADDEPYYKRSVCCEVRKGKPNGCDYFWPSHVM